MELLIKVLLRAERTGKWPTKVGIVAIVLLPKEEGGYRPIGLLPFSTKIWMKARRDIGLEWERMQARPYLYAGERRGADIAAWKQAARVELASTTKTPVGYAQALLDLIKAFERIPHSVLAREAKELGYPLWMLRLSIATYQTHPGRTHRLRSLHRTGCSQRDRCRIGKCNCRNESGTH